MAAIIYTPLNSMLGYRLWDKLRCIGTTIFSDFRPSKFACLLKVMNSSIKQLVFQSLLDL